VAGTWKDLTDNVNSMASNLTSQVRNIADVTTAVARGDLGKKITVDVQGEILELKNTINTMVDQLGSFASEVTRVAREVGTEGKLGGQASVPGAAGTWKDLTDNVNSMAANLTTQVRGIAKVVTGVARGELNRKLVLEAKGEIAALADTINAMIDTLAVFGDQVTTVARDVGIDGHLGGQARVPGAAGLWRDLTDNVNQLAANLTTQVRAIAEVATAVTKGDLSRTIAVAAKGEVAALKDNINQMIANLKDTTRKNTEQDWLNTNVARFSRMLQGERDLHRVTRLILTELAPVVNAQRGAFYVAAASAGNPQLALAAEYAGDGIDTSASPVARGLVAQCARDRRRVLLDEVPPDYLPIASGLGSVRPRMVAVLPVLFNDELKGVIELAAMRRFGEVDLAFLEQLTESIGIVLNTLAINMRTEALLTQSQALAEQLKRTNRELEAQADQLALTSKYKSEFLSNMSHELRTPLNSLMLLSEMLSQNPEGNLSGRQVEFARTIHASGAELLDLINDILDLSRIEAGATVVELASTTPAAIGEYVERTFRHVAESRGLGFHTELDHGLPAALSTGVKRLQQVLKNLLSNAFKFTERGGVSLRIAPASGGWGPDHPILDRAQVVVAFAVTDTGVGIAPERHATIFEAFQNPSRGSANTGRGTGLGLSISRSIARMLGGELTVESVLGKGSTFTLYLPAQFEPPPGFAVAVAESAPPAREPRAGRPAPAAVGSVEEPEPPRTPDPAFTGATVLIVDDDMRNIFALSSVLSAKGLNVLHAETVEAALAVLEQEPRPLAILMDIMLPGTDGYEGIRRLRADERYRHLPVIAVTAKAMKGDREKCLAEGATAYLAKPVSNTELLAMLRQVRDGVAEPDA
jgi:signal transduction histidine kinase/HAMP domain-containing protein/ActR/RegA family two-component response regulator